MIASILFTIVAIHSVAQLHRVCRKILIIKPQKKHSCIIKVCERIIFEPDKKVIKVCGKISILKVEKASFHKSVNRHFETTLPL